jgi:two-component system sensor histidine kinase/response regulator
MELTKEQLKLLVECAPEPTVVYLVRDEKAAPVPFLYSSDVPAFSGLSEKEYLELYQSDAEKVVLPQDLLTLQNTLRRIFREGVAGTCTYRTYHKTMGTVWTHAALKWIGQYEGKEVLLGTFSDVSNQVAEDTPGGFFIYSAQEDDQFFFVGDNMLKMLGYTREEFEQKFQNRFRFMVYEKDRKATLKSIADQISANGHYDKVDYRIEKRDRSLIWVHDEGHYVVDKDGRPWFYVTISDMSELVEEKDKLRRENTELGAVISSIPVGLAVYRLDPGRMELIAANEMIGEILGAKLDQRSGQHKALFSERVPPDDLAGLSGVMREIRQPGRHESAPFRYAVQSGSWKWLRMEAKTIAMPDGSLLVYSVLTDLTAEKRAEEELERAHRTQQEQYRSSLQALLFANPQSLCTVRLNLSRNKCEEWYGTSKYVIHTIKAETAEGVIENISRIIVSEKDREKFRRHFGRSALLDAYRNGQRSETVQYRRTVEDGSFIWVKTVVNMVQDPDTQEIEAVLFSEDVNDQVLNEEIIQKSSDAGYDYIATLYLPDQTFQFRYLGNLVPRNYKDLYEKLRQPKSFAEIVDYASKSWVAPDETVRFLREASVSSILSHLSDDESYTVNLKSRKPNGAEGWKQLRLTWLDETKNWILIQQTDVSEAVHMQQAELLERLNTERALRNEADRANESKSNFISNVSHDMRTPLNAILGYDRLALETDSAAAREKYLTKIGAAGETLLSLINDTLDLQKIENGVTTLRLAPVPCSEVVSGVLTAVKPLLEAKKVHFTFDNSKAAWATIYADATRVEEIFINLISNAVKFTPEGGDVLLAVECVKETPDELCDKLIVRDSGVGISEDFLPKIYEPFTQERTEKTAGIGGSGLGLSIVKRLVSLMHGRIEVKSKLGEGTEFTVYLNFRKANGAGSADVTAQAEDQSVLQGKTILLCEDNEMNREIATAILEKKGMTVLSAVNGKEGAAYFAASQPGAISAILMDIRMPVMDGYEAAAAIRASRHPDAKRVPIVALSADAYIDDVHKAEECGMNGHLSKPIDPELVYSTLHRLIGSAD